MKNKEHHAIKNIREYGNFLFTVEPSSKSYPPDEVVQEVMDSFILPLYEHRDISLVNFKKYKNLKDKSSFSESDQKFLNELEEYIYIKDKIHFLRSEFLEVNGARNFIIKGMHGLFSVNCYFVYPISDYLKSMVYDLVKIDRGWSFPLSLDNLFSGRGKGCKTVFNNMSDDFVLIFWLDEFRSFSVAGKGEKFERFFKDILFKAIDEGVIDG